jgi:hypothetical protein
MVPILGQPFLFSPFFYCVVCVSSSMGRSPQLATNSDCEASEIEDLAWVSLQNVSGIHLAKLW